jgi:hypothetical protein
MALAQTRSFAFSVFDESPWYRPLAPLVARFFAHQDFPRAEELTALHRERVAHSDAAPLVFVPAPPKAKKRRRGRTPITLGSLYEGRIVEAHEVPTREADWHDLFNALAFCAFPRSKWALHARQYRCYAARISPGMTRLPGARTREQDALALFDEGGLLVCLSAQQEQALPTDPELVDTALTALVRTGQATPVPFGHALYEHLALGHAPPLAYAQVLALDEPIPDLRHTPDLVMLDAIDRALSRVLDDPRHFREPERSRGLSLSELLRTNEGDDGGVRA